MRIAMDYAPTNWLMVGAGRSSFDKTYDLYAKGRILRQSTGEKNMPISLSGYADVSIITDTSDALLDTFLLIV